MAAPNASALSYREEATFGEPGNGQGQFSQPQGIAIDPQDGEVFVADSSNHRIQVFTPDGVFVRSFGTLGTAPGQVNVPEGVGVSPVAPNDVYVADTNNNRVERFTNDGTFISAFGSIGSGPGQLEFPRNIAFDPQGNIYVGDTGANNRVTRWSPDGVFQNVVGGLASGFSSLGGLAASQGGSARLYATDANQNTVSAFSFDGTTGVSFQSGVLLNPQGVGVQYTDTTATVFVADAGNHRVAVFGGGGPLMTTFRSPQFVSPSSVAWSPVTGRVYVLEGNNASTSVSVWQDVPLPVLGKTMDIQVDTGKVFYKPPGSKKFKRLRKVSVVKSGTVIDARRGTVSITSVLPSGALQSADFSRGVFKAIQKKRTKGLTDARLVGGNFKRCPKLKASAAKTPKQGKLVRQLWADGKGKFRTTGRYLSASVRGTAWQTLDSCFGSKVTVTEGSVLVNDFLNHRSVTINAGGFYSNTVPHAP